MSIYSILGLITTPWRSLMESSPALIDTIQRLIHAFIHNELFGMAVALFIAVVVFPFCLSMQPPISISSDVERHDNIAGTNLYILHLAIYPIFSRILDYLLYCMGQIGGNIIIEYTLFIEHLCVLLSNMFEGILARLGYSGHAYLIQPELFYAVVWYLIIRYFIRNTDAICRNYITDIYGLFIVATECFCLYIKHIFCISVITAAIYQYDNSFSQTMIYIDLEQFISVDINDITGLVKSCMHFTKSNAISMAWFAVAFVTDLF